MKKVKLTAAQTAILLLVFEMYSFSEKVDAQLDGKTAEEAEELELTISADELEEVKDVLDQASKDDDLKDSWNGITEIMTLIDTAEIQEETVAENQETAEEAAKEETPETQETAADETEAKEKEQ